MTENEVVIQQDPASQICDVVVRVGGREIDHRCPDYSWALKWARMECRVYKISQLRIEPPIARFGAEFDDEDVPLFLRSPAAPDFTQ